MRCGRWHKRGTKLRPDRLAIPDDPAQDHYGLFPPERNDASAVSELDAGDLEPGPAVATLYDLNLPPMSLDDAFDDT